MSMTTIDYITLSDESDNEQLIINDVDDDIFIVDEIQAEEIICLDDDNHAAKTFRRKTSFIHDEIIILGELNGLF